MTGTEAETSVIALLSRLRQGRQIEVKPPARKKLSAGGGYHALFNSGF